MEKLKTNPWLQMWIHPRKTISTIVKSNPKYRFGALSFVYGLPMMLHLSQSFSLAEKMSLTGIVILSLILATFVGMLAITISSALLYWTGKFIGGKASFLNVRAAVSWANVPNVVNILLWIILMAVFGLTLFFQIFPYSHFPAGQIYVLTAVYLTQIVLSIWSFIMLLKALGEVQGFSAWKALLNVVIPFAIILVAVWVLVFIVWLSNGMP